MALQLCSTVKKEKESTVTHMVHIQHSAHHELDAKISQRNAVVLCINYPHKKIFKQFLSSQHHSRETVT